MIYATIIRIKNQYTEDEAARATADEKLRESEKRLRYYRFEIDRLMAALDPAKVKGNSAETAAVLKTIRMIRSPFDYWRPMGCLTTESLEFKITELLYKLHIEEKIRDGSIKYVKAITALNADTAQVRATLLEAYNSLDMCEAKIALMNAAVKAYKTLLIDRPFGQFDETGGEEGESVMTRNSSFSDDGIIKPSPAQFNGRFIVHVHEVAKSPADDGQSLMVTFAVDGKERFTEKLKRHEKCRVNFEGVDVDLSGASPSSYVELLVRTKSLAPVGVVFFKLAWLIGNPAEPFHFKDILALEPEGLVRVEFTYRPSPKPVEAEPAQGLFRHNAIQRKRIARLGHQLCVKKFYQLVKCAVCQEFLYQSSAYQCERKSN